MVLIDGVINLMGGKIMTEKLLDEIRDLATVNLEELFRESEIKYGRRLSSYVAGVLAAKIKRIELTAASYQTVIPFMRLME